MNYETSIDLFNKITPTAVLFIYKMDSNVPYVEVADFKLVRDKYVPLNTKPMSRQDMGKLSGIFSKNENMMAFKKEVFNPNLLSVETGFDQRMVVWHTPACVKKLTFHINGKEETSEYGIPPTIFIYEHPDKLTVYCYRESKRPMDKTKLYDSPYPNTMQGNRICLGTNKIDPEGNYKSVNELIAFIEYLFFESPFTHYNNDNTEGSKLWERAKKNKTFPLKNLHPANKILSEIL